jgi:hypothetical protein
MTQTHLYIAQIFNSCDSSMENKQPNHPRYIYFICNELTSLSISEIAEFNLHAVES